MANALARELKTKSEEELGAILSVKAKDLLAENYRRYQDWDDAETLQAIVAYDGFAFAKLDARSLTSDELRRAHSKLVIPSAMYGPLRALDVIKPHRLDMACTKLGGDFKRLAAYWKDLTYATLRDGFDDDDDERYLVNVASDEFSKAVDFKKLQKDDHVTVVKCAFGPDATSTTLKYARGLVARYVLQNDVDDLEALKRFDLDNYAFDPDRSDDTTFFFSQSKEKGHDKDNTPKKQGPTQKKKRKR
mmetsp:Transcript_30805/g.99321  ORF Transcript_30805/g.99321 Transcript_30805/m.99321 type:complete len:247 (+) Transcript_30805:147-887(+)|eukprot:CAMPEP_0118902292 /NCGR_PEP_ID=MMETSP1166-20130328/7642_1 /TAXON_ID=1104430 /ORGANISM="Chrysoreinhardia sp, Strain CCMP3193" /LENGTH=246 /DNA_ID=CAMNT_0006841497 /DNA_START=125 /DNA_END=865 /DNA_ORIENTATION=+